MKFGDIWVPGGSGATFWSVLGPLGVPGWTWDAHCRFLTDFGSPLGLKMGAFGVLDDPLGRPWGHFGDPEEQNGSPEAQKVDFMRIVKIAIFLCVFVCF